MRKMSLLYLSYISFCSPDHHVMITLISQNARLCVTIVIKTIFWFRHLTLNSSLVVIDIISMQYKTKPTPFQKWKKSSFNHVHVNCKSERTSMAWKSGNELIFFVFWIMVSNGRFEKKISKRYRSLLFSLRKYSAILHLSLLVSWKVTDDMFTCYFNFTYLIHFSCVQRALNILERSILFTRLDVVFFSEKVVL